MVYIENGKYCNLHKTESSCSKLDFELHANFCDLVLLHVTNYNDLFLRELNSKRGQSRIYLITHFCDPSEGGLNQAFPIKMVIPTVSFVNFFSL